MNASDGAAWPGDLRRGDVLLGVLVAACIVGASGAGVISGGADTTALLNPGEVAVPVQPVFEPREPDAVEPGREPPGSAAQPTDVPGTAASIEPPDSDPPDSDPTVADPPVADAPVGSASSTDTAPTGAAGPALTAVPPRPADAPPPSADRPPAPRGGIKSLPRLSNPRAPELPGIATEPGFGPGGPGIAPGPADPEHSPSDPYAYVDPDLEDPAATPGAPGLVGGSEEPGVDPAAERAVAIFRQRLQRWISVHFVVSGAGLSTHERDDASVHAVIVLDADRTLIDYTVESEGHPALRAAADDALQILLGSRAPEPPEHYPGPVQRRIRVTFRCTEATCD